MILTNTLNNTLTYVVSRYQHPNLRGIEVELWDVDTLKFFVLLHAWIGPEVSCVEDDSSILQFEQNQHRTRTTEDNQVDCVCAICMIA